MDANVRSITLGTPKRSSQTSSSFTPQSSTIFPSGPAQHSTDLSVLIGNSGTFPSSTATTCHWRSSTLLSKHAILSPANGVDLPPSPLLSAIIKGVHNASVKGATRHGRLHGSWPSVVRSSMSNHSSNFNLTKQRVSLRRWSCLGCLRDASSSLSQRLWTVMHLTTPAKYVLRHWLSSARCRHYRFP
jgi:hypothetical protein